jgi:hypothetical protein
MVEPGRHSEELKKRPYPTLSFSEKARTTSHNGRGLYGWLRCFISQRHSFFGPTQAALLRIQRTSHLLYGVAALLTLAARVMARVSFPTFCAVPEYVFRVKTGIWRSRCVPIIGAVLFLLLCRQRNEAERRLRLDGQIAVCFQNGQSQIQKFISHYITELQETSPTFRALSKADHVPLRPVRTPTKSL